MLHYFLDIDHTILTDQGDLLPPVQTALQAHQAQITLCSGRHPDQMRHLITQLQLTAPQVALNGSLILDPQGQPLVQHPIPRPLVQRVQQLVQHQFGTLNFTWMDADRWRVTRRDATTAYDEAAGLPAQVGAEVEPTDQPLMLLIIVQDPHQFAALAAAIRRVAPQLTIAAAGDGYLTITAPGVDKGQAVLTVAKLMGQAPATLVAVGDDQNDLGMLQVVGHPGAVANAQPAVRAAAEFILPANTVGGIADLFTAVRNSGGNVSPLS